MRNRNNFWRMVAAAEWFGAYIITVKVFTQSSTMHQWLVVAALWFMGFLTWFLTRDHLRSADAELSTSAKVSQKEVGLLGVLITVLFLTFNLWYFWYAPYAIGLGRLLTAFGSLIFCCVLIWFWTHFLKDRAKKALTQ